MNKAMINKSFYIFTILSIWLYLKKKLYNITEALTQYDVGVFNDFKYKLR